MPRGPGGVWPFRIEVDRGSQGKAFLPFRHVERVCAIVRVEGEFVVVENLEVAIPPNDPREYEVRFTNQQFDGFVHGTVRLSDNSPAAGYRIRVGPPGSVISKETSSYVGNYQFLSMMAVTTTTDQNGAYQLGGIPAGKGAFVSLMIGDQILETREGIEIAYRNAGSATVDFTVPTTTEFTVIVHYQSRPLLGFVASGMTRVAHVTGSRTDAAGRAVLQVLDSIDLVSIGAIYSGGSRTPADVRYALREGGFPPGTHYELLLLLGSACGKASHPLDETARPEQPISIDIASGLNRHLEQGTSKDRFLAKLRTHESEFRGTKADLETKRMMQAGDVEGLLERFLFILGPATAAIEVR
jgi:hypothetical protein